MVKYTDAQKKNKKNQESGNLMLTILFVFCETQCRQTHRLTKGRFLLNLFNAYHRQIAFSAVRWRQE